MEVLMATKILHGITVLKNQTQHALDLIEKLREACKGNADITFVPANGALMVFLMGESEPYEGKRILQQLEPHLTGAARFVIQELGEKTRTLEEFVLGPEAATLQACA